MLAVPILLGAAASRPAPGQLTLAGAAVSGYLATISAQGWLQSRNPDRFRLPALVYAVAFAGFAMAVVIAHPAVLATALVIVPAGAVILGASRMRGSRSLAATFGQVAVALTLVPAAALVADPAASATTVARDVAPATLVAGIYLAGSVLAVRSVIRERDNVWFAIGSVAAHAAAVPVVLLVLPWPYAVLAGILALRAAALPLARRWRAVRQLSLRPVQVGMVELCLGVGLVVLAFVRAP